jgi:hypothetical protein
MNWPTSQDYNEAIQHAASSFSDPALKSGEVVVNAIGLPVPRSGNFADVYQFKGGDGKTWALKCFTRKVAGLQERYAKIDEHIGKANFSFTVGFNYLADGIRVRGQWFPLLKMEWVEGFTLNEFVRENAGKPQYLQALVQMWSKLCARLRDGNFAHADLQHGNVLLAPGDSQNKLGLKVIDYDGMWVPALAEHHSGEVGHPNYQHPLRLKDRLYNADVDRFPHLLIVAALRATMLGGRALWERFDNGDNLLFKEADLRDPGAAPIFKTLWALKDDLLCALVGKMALASCEPLRKTPWLDDLLEEKKGPRLTSDEEETVMSMLGVGPHFTAAKAAPPAPSPARPAAVATVVAPAAIATPIPAAPRPAAPVGNHFLVGDQEAPRPLARREAKSKSQLPLVVGGVLAVALVGGALIFALTGRSSTSNGPAVAKNREDEKATPAAKTSPTPLKKEVTIDKPKKAPLPEVKTEPPAKPPDDPPPEEKKPQSPEMKKEPLPEAKPSPPRELPPRLPVPDAEAQAKFEAILKKTFKEDYSKKKSPDRVQFAQKLHKQAKGAMDNAERYVLYRQSCDLFIQGGDLASALLTADELSQVFAVEPTSVAIRILDVAAALPVSAPAALTFLEAALRLIDQVIAQNDFKMASHLLFQAENVIRAAKNFALLGAVKKKSKKVEVARSEFDKVKAAADKLALDPNDPEANAAYGKYVCLHLGRWDDGLALLLKGNDEALKRIARLEVYKLDSLSGQIGLAQAWVDQSNREVESDKAASLMRAYHWLRRVRPKAVGDIKTKVDEMMVHMPRQYLVDMDEFDFKRGEWGLGKGKTGDQPGTAIRVCGTPSSLGLGMHPPPRGFCSVKYRLAGAAKTFAAAVAIDDDVAKAESPLTFSVLGDGKPLWTSQRISVSRQVETCLVGVEGVTILELRVTCSANHGSAHAVWVDPCIARATGPLPAGPILGDQAFFTTDAFGGKGGNPFEDLPGGRAQLVGLMVHALSANGARYIHAIQPIYQDATGKRFRGKTYGDPSGDAALLEAKEGFVVSSLSVRYSGTVVNGLQLKFEPIAGEKEPYSSAWAGGNGQQDVTLEMSGKKLVGVFGRSGSNVDSLGAIFSD